MLIAPALVFASVTLAETPAQKTFAVLKTLKGTWGMTDGKETAKIIYKITGAGSTIIETQMPGTSMEMVSVYHLDGPNKLVLTHYCAAQNQPTLNLLPGATAKTFNFDFVSGSNMKPTDMHIHAVKYTIVDKNHIITEWQGWMDGKPAGKPEKFDLHRLKA